MEGPYIAEVASLVGDPTRANMLAALMTGQALTAKELAFLAGVTPQTASGHLGKLSAGGLISLSARGRHRYYRLASAPVAAMLEALMTVAAVGPPRHRPRSMRDEALAEARTCYDHLAGRLGVALADALMERGLVALDAEGGEITETGRAFLAAFGADPPEAKRGRVWCRPCLDWSERRPHLAGQIGRSLADRLFGLGWVQRAPTGRAVTVSAAGRAGLVQTFGLAWPPA